MAHIVHGLPLHRRIPLLWKLLAATVVSVMFFLAYLGYTIVVFGDNNSRLEHARDVGFPALETATEQVARLDKIIDDQIRAVTTGERDSLAAAALLADQTRVAWTHLRAIDPGHTVELERLAREFDNYYGIASSLTETFLIDGIAASADATKRMAIALNSYRGHLNAFRALLRGQFTRAVEDATGDSNRAIAGGTTIAVIGLATCLIFGAVAALSVKRQVDSVVSSFREIAGGEADLSRRIPVTSSDEMGELVSWFNLFVDRLQGALGERLAAEEELRKLGLAVAQSPLGIVITDLSGKIEFANFAICDMSATRQADLAGADVLDLFADPAPHPAVSGLRARLELRAAWSGELVGRRRGGEVYDAFVRLAPIRSNDGNVRHILLFQEDITERKRIAAELERHRGHLEEIVADRTSELASAKEVAEAASRSKSEFLANMSHEMRTPMHAILSFAAMGRQKTERRDVPIERLNGYFVRIDDSGRRLMRLLNDLLDLAKLEAGRIEYRFGLHAVESIVQVLVEELALVAEGRGVRLEVAVGRPGITAWCDPPRVEQVLRNLIANAIKFSPPDQAVTIAIEEAVLDPRSAVEGDVRRAVRVTVIDRGVGIPEAELEHIFDKFVQSSRTRTGAGGIGLGLAIAREIVAQHGGRIWAEPAQPRGAKLSVLLPVDEAAADRAPGVVAGSAGLEQDRMDSEVPA